MTIILITSEQDDAIARWLIKHLDALKQLGYRDACLDYCDDIPFREFASMIEKANVNARKKLATISTIQKVIQHFQTNPIAITKDQSEYMLTALLLAGPCYFNNGLAELNQEISKRSISCCGIRSSSVLTQNHDSDSNRDQHEMYMAQQIKKAIERTNGKVIISIGSGHLPTIPYYFAQQGISIETCIFVDLFNPEQMRAYCDDEKAYLIKEACLTKTLLQAMFPPDTYFWKEVTSTTNMTQFDTLVLNRIKQQMDSDESARVNHRSDASSLSAAAAASPVMTVSASTTPADASTTPITTLENNARKKRGKSSFRESTVFGSPQMTPNTKTVAENAYVTCRK